MEDLENLNIDPKVNLTRVMARRIFKLFPTGIKLTTWRNAAINQQKSTLKYLRVLSQPHPVQFTFRGLLVSTCDSLGKSAQNQGWQPCVSLHWLLWWFFVSFPKVSWFTKCGGLRSNIERGSNLNLHARDQIKWKSGAIKQRCKGPIHFTSITFALTNNCYRILQTYITVSLSYFENFSLPRCWAVDYFIKTERCSSQPRGWKYVKDCFQ